MKHNRYLLLFFIFTGMLLGSCQKPENEARHIPKDALAIFSLNVNNLSKKVGWSLLADSRILDALARQDSAFDIEQTGIDPRATLIAYGLPDNRLKSGFKFLALLPLKKEQKFKTYLKARFPGTRFQRSGDLEFARIDANTMIGWKNKLAIGAFQNPSGSLTLSPDPAREELPEDILKEAIRQSFDLPEKESIRSNRRFVALLKAAHDMSYWFNYEAFAAAMPAEDLNTAEVILSGQKKLIRDTYLAGGIDFEKGKITSDARYYFNPSGKAIARAFTTHDFNRELLQRIPGTNMNLMADMHIDPSGIRILIDSMGMLPLTKLGLQENGLSPDSVFNLFDGDFLLTVTDLDFQNIHFDLGDKQNESAPFFQAALTFKVRNSNTLQKLLDTATQKGLISKTGPDLYRIKNNYLGYAGSYVVISPFAQTVAKLLRHTGSQNWQLPEAVHNKPFAFYFDVQHTLNGFFHLFKKGSPIRAADSLIENITAYSDNMKPDYIPFHAEISFQNKSENSLLQLIRFSKIWNSGSGR